jgi:hypothetical protein
LPTEVVEEAIHTAPKVISLRPHRQPVFRLGDDRCASASVTALFYQTR